MALTDDLTALGAQAISRDDRLRAFERLRVPSVATLSEATIIRIGQVVGAEQVIVGSFDVNGNALTIRASDPARCRPPVPRDYRGRSVDRLLRSLRKGCAPAAARFHGLDTGDGRASIRRLRRSSCS